MTRFCHPNRRTVLAAAGAGALVLTQAVRAQTVLSAGDFGVTANSGSDQTAAMQQALDQAGLSGETLLLPPGEIQVEDLTFPDQIALEGSGAGSALTSSTGKRVGVVGEAHSASFINIIFGGSPGGTPDSGIIEVTASDRVSFERCVFTAGNTGLVIFDSAVTITNCTFGDHDDAAIHASNSRGLIITGNRIAVCGNAGIRIWRDEPGADGSIVTGNRIATVVWRRGGNGQNGNGINLFKADGVIVANNTISKCAFSAIRLNTTRNTQVSGNVCTESGEVAVFSEFAFSGSVIANNIVDGAAGGISMTNYNEGGHVAVCTGNIVRNIAPKSLVNPDTTPFGIAAEAEAAVTGNTVFRVPGPAFVAGYGPYLSNVLIADNVMYDILVGVAVSVAPGAGNAQVTNNMIFNPEHAVVGMAWADMVEPDLIANAGKYPLLTISNNTVGEVQGP